MTEVAPGIYAVDHAVADGKNAVLIGERRALAIDGGMFEEDGQRMADFLRSKGWEPDYLALTHGHGDHVLGAQPLARGDIFAHELMPSVIAKQVPGWAQRWECSEEEAARRVIKPTVLYRDELRIDLGGKTAHFFPTPGHSVDGVSAYIQEERALIAGDVVVSSIIPACGDGDSRVLEASLRRLSRLEIDVMVTGHGPVLYGVQRNREWILWLADYLRSVRAVVRERLNQGDDKDAAVDAVGYDEFVGDRLPKDRNGQPRRHRATVEKIADEELRDMRGNASARREEVSNEK